jgi:mannose/cellobiose epimerase-like protein (N-acyl-D-glucosamine 2-epimerase family)
LKTFGDRYGFDAEGFVVGELLDDGRVHKSSRRCWPHTEAIKAEVAAAETGDRAAAARAARTIDRLLAVFLGRPVAGGWIDHVDANGAPIVDAMPASTLYHVFLAAAEADRVWGKRETQGKQAAHRK